MRLLLIAAIALTLCGCPGLTDSTDALDLSGKWSGPITATIQGASQSATLLLELTQSGETVTGKASFSGDSVVGTASGKLVNSRLTLTLTSPQKPYDDCHLYSSTWTYTASSTTLTVTSVSGTNCVGNGSGGHTRLEPITGGSGTLTKQ